MGKEQDSVYYDQQWSGNKWRKNWNEISKVRTRLYTKAAELMPAQAPLVVDLGCGGGHFGQAMKALNPPDVYIGYDFSEAGIHFAKKKLGHGDQFQFFQADLTDMKQKNVITPGASFVCLEVLEHITNDLRIFDLIPDGSNMVISVPTFDEPSHVRHFKDWPAVVKRYGQFMDLKTVKMHAIWKWFLFTAIKETNAS